MTDNNDMTLSDIPKKIIEILNRLDALEKKDSKSDRLIGTAEARKILGNVSRLTLSKYVERGWLANKARAGHPKYQLSEVMRLVDGNS